MAPAASYRLSRGKRLLFWAFLVGSVGVFSWGASVVARATSGYFYVKAKPQGWRGKVVAPDARLGVAAIPGASGAEILLRGGVETPVRFDGDGFRVPMEPLPGGGGPKVMALGCSYTFGTGCKAEETYPWLVAQALGGRAMNAGQPGYGLAQMLALAKALVPRHRPDVLLLQASPWLPGRAARRFRRTGFDLLPNPYFVEGKDGNPLWQPPMFLGKAFALPISRYRDTPESALDWASFVSRVGFPLFLHDDAQRVRLFVGRTTGRLSDPPSMDRISAYVYPEILRICRENGTRMVVVVIDSVAKDAHPESAFPLPPDVLVVGTTPGLRAGLPRFDRETYLRAYAHWRGDPPVLVDEHPNARAHALIAEQVVTAMTR